MSGFTCSGPCKTCFWHTVYYTSTYIFTQFYPGISAISLPSRYRYRILSHAVSPLRFNSWAASSTRSSPDARPRPDRSRLSYASTHIVGALWKLRVKAYHLFHTRFLELSIKERGLSKVSGKFVTSSSHLSHDDYRNTTPKLCSPENVEAESYCTYSSSRIESSFSGFIDQIAISRPGNLPSQ